MPCFPPKAYRLGVSRKLSYLAGEQWAVPPPALAVRTSHRTSIRIGINMGETWDSLVAALLETKISIRAGMRGHPREGEGDVLDGMTIHPSNPRAQHCGTGTAST